MRPQSPGTEAMSAPPIRRDLFVYGRDTLAARRHFASVQRGHCAICGTRPAALRLDHEHSDLSLCRGLLCDNCNAGLGWFRDDPAALRAAADYVEAHTARNEAYRQTSDYESSQTRSYRRRLTQEERERRNATMRLEFENGAKVETLCRRFSLSRAQVYEILYGDTA